jgi:hypothetical protein
MAAKKEVELNNIVNIPDTLKCIKRDHEDSLYYIRFEFKCDVCDSITAKSIRSSDKHITDLTCEHCDLQNNINDKINELKSYGWYTVSNDLSLKSKNEYKCLDCGTIAKAKQDFHTKIKTVRNREGTNGCMHCHINAGMKDRLDKHTPLLKQMEEFGFTILDKSNYAKMILKCNHCKHEFNKSLYVFDNKLGLSCPECNSGNKLRTGIEPNLPKPEFKTTNRYQQLKDVIKTKNVTILNEDNVDHVRCECNDCKHIFYKSLENIARSQNSCPLCYKVSMSNRKLQQSQHPIMERINSSNIRLVGPYIGIKKHQDVKCTICDTIFKATPIAVLSAFEKNPNSSHCPTCNKDKQDNKRISTVQRYIDKLDKIGDYEILTNNIQAKNQKIEVYRKTCGHTFAAQLNNIADGISICSVCNNTNKTNRLKEIWQKVYEYNKANESEYKKFTKLVWKYTRLSKKHHMDKINPDNLPITLAGQGGYHVDHILSINYCFNNNISAEVCGDYSNLRTMEASANISKSTKLVIDTPPELLNHISNDELLKLFKNEVNKLDNIEFVNDHIAKYDNGHINLMMFDDIDDKKDLVNIHKQYENCYSILQDEWKNNAVLIYDKIKHLVKQSDKIKIHARQCIIEEVDYDDVKDFINAHHIQKTQRNGSINLAAYYNGDMIAVMNFSKPRFNNGNKHIDDVKYYGDECFELLRFCTHSDYVIPGIASKLLTYFKNNHFWTAIYSYANKRYSSGNVYTKLGFTLESENNKGYYYIKDGISYDRYGFYKKDLSKKLEQFDEALTEEANVINNGYVRLDDIGQYKFVMFNDLV